jgi:SpoU rRNA methylase family enzyme
VSSEYIAKGVDIYCLVVQELDDAITVLRPVHTQCGRDDVFGAEHARFDVAFCRSDFKIDRFGIRQRFRIEVARAVAKC